MCLTLIQHFFTALRGIVIILYLIVRSNTASLIEWLIPLLLCGVDSTALWSFLADWQVSWLSNTTAPSALFLNVTIVVHGISLVKLSCVGHCSKTSRAILARGRYCEVFAQMCITCPVRSRHKIIATSTWQSWHWCSNRLGKVGADRSMSIPLISIVRCYLKRCGLTRCNLLKSMTVIRYQRENLRWGVESWKSFMF